MGRKVGVTVVRQSKHPVNLDNLEKYRDEWHTKYDRLVKRYKKPNQQQTLSYLLAKTEVRLLKKYPNQERWKMPGTIKEWDELISKYGPVAIGKNQETQETILQIIDLGL